jgi:anaerobic magnesium-protoporphyrin IX monomethyl ester cyclase
VLPHAALAALGAQMREDGLCEYQLRDLNLEFFLYQLTRDRVGAAVHRVSDRVENNSFESSDRKEEARALLEKTRDLPQRIEASVAGFRDPGKFYDPETFVSQREDLRTACRILTLQFDRIVFDKYSLFESHSYDGFDEIKAALDDPESVFLRDFYMETIIPQVAAEKPALFGMSVSYFSQLIPSFLLAAEIRKVSPSTHISMGGPVTTWGEHIMVNEASLFSQWIDSFCRGEGELCIGGLVESLGNGAGLDTVPSLVYFAHGQARANPKGSRDIQLKTLATPDYDNMPLDRYLAPDRIISMPLTKGCYYNRCEFCNYAFIKIASYRERPPELAAKDVAQLVERTGERVFSFESDVISPSYLKRFSRALINEGVKIRWHGCMRFERTLDQEFFDILAEAGCIRMYYGMESANQLTLDRMDKGTTVESIEHALKYGYNAGIAVEVGTIVGYPGETPEQARDTLEFIRRNREYIERGDPGLFRMLRGAPIEAGMERHGLTPLRPRDEFWYIIRTDNPRFEAQKKEFLTILREIQDLYPTLTAMDVSEDILQLAMHGRDGVRKIGEIYMRREHLVETGPRDIYY